MGRHLIGAEEVEEGEERPLEMPGAEVAARGERRVRRGGRSRGWSRIRGPITAELVIEEVRRLLRA